MNKLYFLMVLLALFSFSLAENITCLPERETCAECYSALVLQVTGRDENMFHLQKAFFPPDTASPLFVTVYYQYGDRSYNCSNSTAEDDSTQVWFWSSTLFHMFQPIHVFQFTSLLFSDWEDHSSEVCVMLDPECIDAEREHMRLLTQRVSCSWEFLNMAHLKNLCSEVVLF